MSQTDRIDLAALLARLGLGVMFIAHALLKIFVFTVPGTVQFFESVGLPAGLVPDPGTADQEPWALSADGRPRAAAGAGQA